MDFSWLWVVPVLGILIIVHEMGHFFTAIWLGIKVEEFGIGFPPRVFAIRRKGIDYSLNLLPIGGFVKITGENGDSDDPRSFGKAPAWKRVIVLAAGSAMNLLLAILIFTGMSVAGTREIAASQTAVGTVLAGQPAERGGIKPGDHILSVDGQAITSSDQLRSLSRTRVGKPTTFTVERGGKPLDLTITPQGDPPLGVGLSYWVTPAKIDTVKSNSVAARAGLEPGDVIVSVNGAPVNDVTSALFAISSAKEQAQVVVQRNGQRLAPVSLPTDANSLKSLGLNMYYPVRIVYYSPGEALGRALGSTWDVISSIPKGIAQAVAGSAQGPGVTSIVGISQLTGEVAQQAGINGLLSLTALLGISLFMINLMPLPALDGGRLLFIVIELLRGGRRIAPEKEAVVHFAGMMVLLGLMALITYFDVARLFQGQSLIK